MLLCLFQVEVIKKAYQQGEADFDDDEENSEEHAASPRNVGHNIYILAHQVNIGLNYVSSLFQGITHLKF